MRSLKEFILESNEYTIVESSKNGISILLKGLENAEETLKSLKEKSIPGVEIDEEGSKVVVNVSKDNVDELDTLIDILQQYGSKLRNSQKFINNESYAQNVVTLLKALNKITDAIDDINGEEEPKKDDEGKKEEE